MVDSDPEESSSDDRKQISAPKHEIDTDNPTSSAELFGRLRDESTKNRWVEDSQQKLMSIDGDRADQRHAVGPQSSADVKTHADKKSITIIQHGTLLEKAAAVDDEKPQAKSSRVHSNSKGSKRQRCAVAQEGAIPVSDLRIEYDEAKMNLLQV